MTMVSTDIAARITGSPVHSIRRWIYAGRVRAEKRGRFWLVSLSDLRDRKAQKTRAQIIIEEYAHMVRFVGHEITRHRLAGLYGVTPEYVDALARRGDAA